LLGLDWLGPYLSFELN
jgi:hypothetical protein